MLQRTQTTKHTRKVFVPVKIKWTQKETNQILSDFKKAVKETKKTQKEIVKICNIVIRRKRVDLFKNCKEIVKTMYYYKHIYESGKINPNLVTSIGHETLQFIIKELKKDLFVMNMELGIIEMCLGII